MNARGFNGHTPLHRYEFDNIAIVEALVKAGTDVNARDDDGNTPLNQVLQLVHVSDVEAVEALVEAGADVSARDNDGNTPLFNTARLGYVEAVEALVEAGADVNARRNDGRTPLYLADNSAVVEVLLKAGADVNARDDDGFTPLDDALWDRDYHRKKLSEVDEDSKDYHREKLQGLAGIIPALQAAGGKSGRN